MTDKQIIIDGVDVRKCVNRRWDNSQKIHLCYDSDTPLTSWGWCENNPNCYYKQLEKLKAENLGFKILHESDKDLLKRKEQECEELKKQLKEMNEVIRTETTRCSLVNSLKTELDQLKAENDELKKKCNIYTCGICGNKEDCNKLYKILTEIKEIAEICKCHNADGCYECKYFDDCEVEDEEIPTRDVCKLILQKISEVENG